LRLFSNENSAGDTILKPKNICDCLTIYEYQFRLEIALIAKRLSFCVGIIIQEEWLGGLSLTGSVHIDFIPNNL